MKRGEKSREGPAEKQENLGEKLRRGVLVVGKRGGQHTPVLPPWRLLLPPPPAGGGVGGGDAQDSSFIEVPPPPPSLVSARKLAATLWELHHYRFPLSKMHHGVPVPPPRLRRLHHHHHHHQHKGLDLTDPSPSSPDLPGSASGLRRHVAASLMQHHRSIERNNHAIQPVSPSSYGSSMEAIQHAHSFSMQSFENREKLAEKKREVSTLQKTNKSLQSKMKMLEDQAEVAIKEKDDAEEKVGAAEAINKVFQAQLKEAEEKVAQAQKELHDALATKVAEIKDADEKAYAQGIADVTEAYEQQVKQACNRGFSLGWMSLLKKINVPKDSPLRSADAIPLPFPPPPPPTQSDDDSDSEDQDEDEALVRKSKEATGAKSLSQNEQVFDLTQDEEVPKEAAL